jgi:hypothetical protein
MLRRDRTHLLRPPQICPNPASLSFHRLRAILSHRLVLFADGLRVTLPVGIEAFFAAFLPGRAPTGRLGHQPERCVKNRSAPLIRR